MFRSHGSASEKETRNDEPLLMKSGVACLSFEGDLSPFVSAVWSLVIIVFASFSTSGLVDAAGRKTNALVELSASGSNFAGECRFFEEIVGIYVQFPRGAVAVWRDRATGNF
jgi:hypothetical protein